MEEFKDTTRALLVPSFTLFLSASGAALLGYGLSWNHGRDTAAGFCLCIIALSTVYPVYRNSLAVAGAGKGNIARWMLFMLLVTITGAAAWRGAGGIAGCPPQLGPPPHRCLVENAERRRHDRRLLLCADNGCRCRIAAVAPPECDILPGDILSLRESPDPIAPPGVNRLDDQYRRRGILYRTYLADGDWRLERRQGPGVRWRIRTALEARIGRLFSPESAPLVSALYSGNASRMDRRTVLNFKRAGVLHILAASGFNVGIVAMVPLALLGLFRVPRRGIALATIATILAYLAITDMPVSLLRAVAMASFYSLLFIFGMERSILNVLFLAGTLIVAVLPHELYSLGFQLSFGATLGIILLFKPYRRLLRGLPGPLADSMAITLSAQIPVIPIIAWHVEELTIAGFLTNLWAVPLTALIMYLSIAALAISDLCIRAATLIAGLTDLLCTINRRLIELAASLNLHYSAALHHPAVIIMMLLLVAPLLPLLKPRWAKLVLLLCALILPVLLLSPQHGGPERMVFSSHGSAVELRRREATVTITGSIRDFSTARAVLKEAIRSHCSSLTLILPEPDYRDIRSFSYIAKNAPVTACVIGPRFRISPSLGRFFSDLERDGVTVTFREPRR
ncbi:MAG: ComEC/Rec2 family competence protein [Spirochaetes bacterium]|nr:ComEC/Rec2 family competence protein [Spirochaetota bacterium]